MYIEKTQINDRNIHSLVKIYVENKDRLPNDLKNIPIGEWDVSNVTDMTHLFSLYDKFNESINNWNVSKVTNMHHMFNGCSSFNQPLDKWVVTNVTFMNSMFYGCSEFNQSLDNWDVSNVESMESMFEGCVEFNQPLNKWTVTNVTQISNMFDYCLLFNQPLDNWDVSNVESMNSTFQSCKKFNQPLNNWVVSNVTAMGYMFYGCTDFNQPLDSWDVSNVEDMESMFEECIHFNQNLRNWDISSIENMENMFEACPIDENNKPIFNENVPRVDAQQIHKESAKINYEKLNNFFYEKIQLDVPSDIDYSTYINDTIMKMINESDEPEETKTEQIEGLRRIMTERLNNINYTYFSKLQLDSIFYTLQYVITQPVEFQKIYVDTFIKDCVHAYEGPDGMTCVMGALERIVMSLIHPCQTLLTTGENEDYEKIIAIIIANPSKLIPEYILDWYKLHKTGTDGAFPPGTTVEEKKENLKKYLLGFFPNENELIDSKISENADNIGYDDDDFMYGGRKKKNKTKKNNKTNKKNNTQKNKKTKKNNKKTKKINKKTNKNKKTKKSNQ